ncbi:MAG: phosphoribosylaminoimidazolesuccinocarboxamide synthase [Elusimicrobiales bacterium]
MELQELKLYKGKVRDIYYVGDDKLLIVSTDRISAFDFVLPNEIPYKGEVLNQISLFWFDKTKDIIKNHLISADINTIKRLTAIELDDYYSKRTILAYRAKRVDFECIVRGYIVGNGWKEYEKTKSICGIKLPDGLKYAQKLPQPIFTPTTKADFGHDESVDFDYMASKIGDDVAVMIRDISLKLYHLAHNYLIKKGIILADTKFEFGFLEGELILIDEAITPDSSRFWDAKTYEVGKEPQSYDKQLVRNYLLSTYWDRKSPPPPLPDDVVKKTSEKYIEIMRLITAKDL